MHEGNSKFGTSAELIFSLCAVLSPVMLLAYLGELVKSPGNALPIALFLLAPLAVFRFNKKFKPDKRHKIFLFSIDVLWTLAIIIATWSMISSTACC